MFKPKYLISLDNHVFFHDQVICLGSQLQSIIQILNGLIEPHIWFGADIDAISPLPKKLGLDSFQLRKIGDSSSLINLCKNIDQFLSGVFIAIKEKKQNFTCPDLRIGTEDEQFRPLSLDGVLIEIRTFDTSYFELYSDEIYLMNKICKAYKTEIQTKHENIEK